MNRNGLKGMYDYIRKLDRKEEGREWKEPKPVMLQRNVNFSKFFRKFTTKNEARRLQRFPPNSSRARSAMERIACHLNQTISHRMLSQTCLSQVVSTASWNASVFFAADLAYSFLGHCLCDSAVERPPQFLFPWCSTWVWSPDTSRCRVILHSYSEAAAASRFLLSSSCKSWGHAFLSAS